VRRIPSRLRNGRIIDAAVSFSGNVRLRSRADFCLLRRDDKASSCLPNGSSAFGTGVSQLCLGSERRSQLDAECVRSPKAKSLLVIFSDSSVILDFDPDWSLFSGSF